MNCMKEADVINAGPDVGNDFGNFLSAFSAGYEVPKRFLQVAIFSLKRNQPTVARQRLSMLLNQLGFVLPEIDVANRSGAKDNDHIFGSRLEMWLARSERFRRIEFDTAFCQQVLRIQETR